METERIYNILFIVALVVVIGLNYYTNYELEKQENIYKLINGQHYQLQKDYDLLIQGINNKTNCDFETEQYKLIIQNLHHNYNNQDERFERMLNWSLETRGELEQMNYRYAMCYEGIDGHRKEDFK